MAAYIKFDGVDGEAQDREHKGWSDLASFGQGLHQPGGAATGATRRRGDVILDDISCSKELDKSSPKIAEAVCKGKVFPKVEIHPPGIGHQPQAKHPRQFYFDGSLPSQRLFGTGRLCSPPGTGTRLCA